MELDIMDESFKWRHYESDIILQCVRWYCKYGISYRDLEEMMKERGVEVNHTTIYRWVQTYGPEIEQRIRQYTRYSHYGSWHVDGTYIKVKGQWKYLYRAVDREGKTIDFMLLHSRSLRAATQFLKRTLRLRHHPKNSIYTDKAPSYISAITDFKAMKKLKPHMRHRQSKYMNNCIEADHSRIKKVTNPTRGFKTFASARSTLKGIEAMQMIRKKQPYPISWSNKITEAQFVLSLFEEKKSHAA